MAEQRLAQPDFSVPIADENGVMVAYWRRWFSGIYSRTGGDIDKVDAAHTLATNAVAGDTEIVAGPGLHVGGALGEGNVGLVLYKFFGVVADLPMDGNNEGDLAYARDGRKPGETAGNGTGVPVWYSPGAPGSWCAMDSGSAVSA